MNAIVFPEDVGISWVIMNSPVSVAENTKTSSMNEVQI